MSRRMPGVRALTRMARMISQRGENECWPWTGRLDEKGYAFIKVHGVTTRAHRVAWTLHHGHWPSPGLVVRHTCDNPPCCNPGHLLIGTVADNMRDMAERGRAHRGEKCGAAAKLTADQVAVIRSRAEMGETRRVLAAEYGMTKQGIASVIHRRTWGHVA